jgi:uncharacterized membrane protein YbhN (UPF0104 family)
MGATASELVGWIERGFTALYEAMAGTDARWLILGVLLHLLNQVARGRGWYSVVRIACPEEPVRARDALGAWVAGAGASGVLSARGGDAVRLVLLRPRTREAGYGVLTGTLVAEAAGEALVGAALVALAVATGLWPAPSGDALPGPAVLAAAAVGIALLIAVARRAQPLRRFARSIASGARALGSPGRYACAVLPWQVASRGARAASIACFLAAFGLPVTAGAVLLVMLAQAGGRALPLAPATAGAGVAILAAGFGPVTGANVEVSQLAAFLLGTSTLLTVVGVALAVVIAARSVGIAAALAAARAARAPARGSAPA